MKQKTFLLALLAMVLAVTGCNCKSKKSANTKKFELAGLYMGKFPAADCGGVAVSLNFISEKEIAKSLEYIDCKEKMPLELFKGQFIIKDSLLTITYSEFPEKEDKEDYYIIKNDSTLAFAGHDKNNIKESENMPDAYVLKKSKGEIGYESETHPTPLGTIIGGSENKYPKDIKLFEDKQVTERLKKLLGKEYDIMLKNFNVETPFIYENGIYKATGCQKNACPSYHTTLYFDLNKDNINVIIDKNGKKQNFEEMGKIEIPKNLQEK